MAIAGRRRVPAGFTNVTYRTVGPIASIASQPELTVFRPEQPCLPFLPTRTMTGAGMRSAPRYHLAYRTGCAAPNCCTRSREPARPLVFGCLGPIPSVLLGDCRRSSEDSPLITDHRLDFGAYPSTVCGRRNRGVRERRRLAARQSCEARNPTIMPDVRRRSIAHDAADDPRDNGHDERAEHRPPEPVHQHANTEQTDCQP